MKETYTLKHDPIVRKIFLAMLAPTILMNLTTAIGSMADTVIIGHYLDDASLSVVTFATPIYMLINTLAALFSVGGCIAMSIDSGKGDKKGANKAFSISTELILLTGILLVFAGIFLMDPITNCLGAGSDVFEEVKTYARIILVSSPVFLLNISFAFFVRNDGRPSLSMAGMFVSIIVDIILNIVFVGFMEMGVAGAAYSTVLGQLVSAIVIATHFFTKKNTLRFRFAFDSTALRIIKNGASSALHFVYQFITILIINHILASLANTDGVVVYTVVFNLSTVSLSVFEGISQTIQPMVSTYFGEKSNKHIKETMRLAFITVLIICGLVTVALEIFPEAVPIVFGIDGASLIDKAADAVRIYATSMIIMTANVVLGYYLQATEQNLIAAVMVSLAATLILGRIFGMNGIWSAYTVSEVLSFGILLVILRKKQVKLNRKNANVDILLLQKDVTESHKCLVFKGSQELFNEYKNAVFAALSEEKELSPAICSDTVSYLSALKNNFPSGNKAGYITTELNTKAGTVIIRDRFSHTDIQENLDSIITNTTGSEYGPVLGWNRICLKDGNING